MRKSKIAEHVLPPPPYMVGYARVSTQDQNLDLQMDALKRAGVKEEDIHVEKISAKANERAALNKAIANLRPGDVFVVWRLDRLARSMRELYRRMDQIYEAGASFRSLTENFDYTTSMGKLLMNIMGAIAEFEAQLIAARTSAGMRALRDSGVRVGAKPKLSPKQKEQIKKLLEKDGSATEIAKRFKVTVGTIYNNFEVKTNAKGKRIVKIKPPRVNKPPARLNKAGLEWKIVSRVFEATANESQ